MPTDVKETKAEPKKLKITLIKSTIGAVPKNKKIVESMGFKKLNSYVILPDNAATRGQIRLISHMVKVADQPHGQGGRTGLREVQNGIIKFKTC